MGPTLTSTGTTNPSASGVIVVLKKAPDVTNQTAYLKDGSQSIKLNTYDFELIDPVTVPSLGDPVVLTNPTWSGRIVSVTLSDIVDVRSGHKRVGIAATNTTAAGATTAPGDLSDVATGGYLQLENGSGNYLLEDGSGYYVLEGSAFSYQGLSVKSTQNIDGTTSTYGMVTVFETGFAAGQTITITSANLGLSAVAYTITNVTETFIGIGVPAYVIEFGDAFLTLQQAGGGVLTTQGSTAAIQAGVVMPGGVLGYAQVTANQTGITTVVDLTGLTVTVTVGSGRRIQITAIALFQDGTIDTQVIMSIQEGATVLQQAAIERGRCGLLTRRSTPWSVILTPTAGVHTYKLTAQVPAGTVQMTAAATTPAFILVEDIGT